MTQLLFALVWFSSIAEAASKGDHGDWHSSTSHLRLNEQSWEDKRVICQTQFPWVR